MALEIYRRKRNFDQTREPRGRITRRKHKDLSFVVHKHDSRRLHYDLRLEMDGVLASWAVPKGPSLNPRERRLAVQVEDHPLEYGDFEGAIPEGEYGAGSVIVWDRGTWQPDGDPAAAYRRGKLKFQLHGEKLNGGWTLVRMAMRNGSDAKNWLLIKDRDGSAQRRDITRDRPESVQSGRTVENVKEGSPRTRRRNPPRGRQASSSRRSQPAKEFPAKSKLASFVRPQLATLVNDVPTGDDWLHEIKFDGYRALCRIDAGRALFQTREGQDWTKRFKPLAAAAQRLPVRSALLDGEVVALGDNGTTDFQLLQNSLKKDETAHLVYFAFDLLHLDGRDYMGLPLRERKQQLEKLLRSSARDALRYSEHWTGKGQELLEECCRKGLEGIISKRIDQPYRSGRGRDWLKIKCSRSQEFIIGGFTEPGGSRHGLGALLVGVRDERGRLRYSGRVGTGFTQQSLTELRSRLNRLERRTSPFSNLRRDAEDVHWVAPKLVAAVNFSEWTRDQLLRHPSFQGLREDKPADAVIREKTSSTEETIERKNSHTENEREIAGVKLTHPDRILFPEQNISKADLAHYYALVSDWILPHLEGRPLTLVRCPEGRKKQCFYQRHVGASLHPPIQTISVKEDDKKISYASVNSLPGLIELVQMGVLEIHTWGARQNNLGRPDRVTFDLDPDPGLPWEPIKEAALTLRSRLARLDLASFVKTTGGKGLHVVVPIKPTRGWDKVKQFARNIAEGLAKEAPELYTASASKTQRQGKIFIDYLRNGRSATAVAAYSSRAREGAPVSVPLRWQELTADPRADHFNISNVPKRLASLRKDPWADYERSRRPLSERLVWRQKI